MNSKDEWLGWLPIRLYETPSGPWLDWCYAGDNRLTEPFFDHSIDRLLRDPFRLLFRRQSSLTSLLEAELSRLHRPAGFIFHMSHCGSTLVAQMLATSAAHVVISEASIIETILRTSPMQETNDHRIGWMQAILNALIRPRRDEQTHAFVKFDSWHAVHLPLIRRAFPDVPWVFLYRDPVEVLVSLSQQTGGRTVPGAIKFGQTPMPNPSSDPVQYHAQVLAQICEGAIGSYTPGLSRFVNYRQLPDAVVELLRVHFRLSLTEDVAADMMRRAKCFGKHPRSVFRDDTQSKQRSATAEIREAAGNRLGDTYAKMEHLSIA